MNDYNIADRTLHYLSQIIAKTNRTYLEMKEDDSHTNLFFDAKNRRLSGRWIKDHDRSFLPGIDLDDFSLILADKNGKKVSEVGVDLKKMNTLEVQFSEVLTSNGFNTDRFIIPMHYQIPDYGFENDPIERPPQSALNKWAGFRALANDACNHAANRINADVEPRIWPHHFDTGIYAVASEKIGIGFGLAMEDSITGDPYFYLNGHAQKKHVIEYTALPELPGGEWIVSDKWKGAVLKLSDLHGPEAPESVEMVQTFTNAALDWYLNS